MIKYVKLSVAIKSINYWILYTWNGMLMEFGENDSFKVREKYISLDNSTLPI
jgi:hypothetical protein